MVVDLTVLVRSYRRLISGEPKPYEGCLAKGDPTISVHASLTYRGPSSSMVSECLTPDDTADIAQSLSCEAPSCRSRQPRIAKNMGSQPYVP
jgi:hypothetical protein